MDRLDDQIAHKAETEKPFRSRNVLGRCRSISRHNQALANEHITQWRQDSYAEIQQPCDSGGPIDRVHLSLLLFLTALPAFTPGLNLIERDQRQSKVPYFLEYAVQGGIVDHRARQESVTIFIPRDRQILKPLRPVTAQLALNLDLIDTGLLWIGF
jgi:hypothetical protein